eukprot:SAG11_NODE_44_length_20765_cov_5.183635_19_plen_92_part_00
MGQKNPSIAIGAAAVLAALADGDPSVQVGRDHLQITSAFLSEAVATVPGAYSAVHSLLAQDRTRLQAELMPEHVPWMLELLSRCCLSRLLL